LENRTISDRPFLSIVIPTYNEERRLPQTLQSVVDYLARQSYASEVIVVDDGSRDQTVEVVKTFRAAHPGVALIRNDHRGKGYAVRTGNAGPRKGTLCCFPTRTYPRRSQRSPNCCPGSSTAMESLSGHARAAAPSVSTSRSIGI